VIAELMSAVHRAPGILLDRLTEKMARLANEQRYEEAAWTRDRHDALVKALQRAWEWRALAQAGWIEIEDRDGTTTVIDHGSLVETRPAGRSPRLRNVLPQPVNTTTVAPNVEAGEEAAVIWRWLGSNQVKVIECTGTFAYPLQRMERLQVVRRQAA
jgi:DNA polymerase-3 subunit epsilon